MSSANMTSLKCWVTKDIIREKKQKSITQMHTTQQDNEKMNILYKKNKFPVDANNVRRRTLTKKEKKDPWTDEGDI